MSRAPNWRVSITRCTVFCLPSVQEGFGIVLLEAMAAGKPIVASRAAAIPETAPHAILVEPESAEALAAGIESIDRSPESPGSQSCRRPRLVERFDAPLVARMFLDAVTPPALLILQRDVERGLLGRFGGDGRNRSRLDAGWLGELLGTRLP